MMNMYDTPQYREIFSRSLLRYSTAMADKRQRSDSFTADDRMALVETMRDFISIIVTNDVTRIPKTVIED